ncbi:hypothetical protein FS749_006779 [Ceratobasidium sp. UAMH 11750]|nr:hypothetical protein FS749_006779 [Ceratobasidium sp. UAMH 11750]
MLISSGSLETTMALIYHERQHPDTSSPPARSKASLTMTPHTIPPTKLRAALQMDILKNPHLITNHDAQKLSPFRLSANTDSTPYWTPRTSLASAHPGKPLFDRFLTPPEAGPSSRDLAPKLSSPSPFRSPLSLFFGESAAHAPSEHIPGSQPKPIIIISSSTPGDEILTHLANSGCSDVTHKLDLGQCETHPTAGGGFGDIYRGTLIGGAKVAIKCPRLFFSQEEHGQKILKNIAREIYAWSKLNHPNILELIGLSKFQNRISIVSPWMENGTLLAYISKKPEVNRYQLCAQICSGLAYLHESNMVHGDVKGLNILISEGGVAKLTDFGNTILKQYTLEFTGTTGSSKISVRWAAPELLNGQGTYTKEADIYALGMTFLETVTGKIPFHGKSDLAVCGTVFSGKFPERPEQLDTMEDTNANTLWKMMLRCWAHNFVDRPTASELKHSLEKTRMNPTP